MPEASRPGISTAVAVVPPKPMTSIIRNAPSNGLPKRKLMAAKLPAAPITITACAGASRFARVTARAPRPPPRASRGASGPITAPSPIEATAARIDTGQFDARRRSSPGLESIGGRVAAPPRKVADGQADGDAGDEQWQDRPPGGLRGEAEGFGQARVNPGLEVVDEPDEEVRAAAEIGTPRTAARTKSTA